MKVMRVNNTYIKPTYINLKAITSVVVDTDDHAHIYVKGESEPFHVRGEDAVAQLVVYLESQAILTFDDNKQ